AGRFFTLSKLLAPTYCETIDETALLVCPRTQISIEIKAPTIPTAAKDSVAFKSMFPTMAVSVRDKIGSDTPAIKAGMANLLICFKLMFVLTRRTRNNKKGIHFDWGSEFLPRVYNCEVRKIFGFAGFAIKYPI